MFYGYSVDGICCRTTKQPIKIVSMYTIILSHYVDYITIILSHYVEYYNKTLITLVLVNTDNKD